MLNLPKHITVMKKDKGVLTDLLLLAEYVVAHNKPVLYI